MSLTLPIRCLDLLTGDEMNARDAGPTLICLGNFDGVHLAHMRLIEETVRVAPTFGANPAIFCFYSPSWESKERPDEGRALTTLCEKIQYFKESGLKYLFLTNFRDCRDVPADVFPDLWLRQNCGCIGTVCGFNYTFGAGGFGRAEDLRRFFADRALILPAAETDDGNVISSSRIRRAIDTGDMETAARLLGRPYSLSGTVVKGYQLGRRLGFPTANIEPPPEKLLPPCGVYVTRCTVGDKSFRAVTNVGVRPTVSDEGRVGCESFLEGFSGDLYGQTVTVAFLRRIRPEMKFSSVEELREAIGRDKAEAFGNKT